MNKGGVVWGVDAADAPDTLCRTADFLRSWMRGLSARVEPVHVRAPGGEDALGFEPPAGSTFLSLKTLAAADRSLASRVEALLSYAESAQASAIALGTRARGALSRLALGSFADSAVFASRLPVLVLNPSAEPSKNLRSVLFAADFSEACREAFGLALRDVKARGLALTVFHAASILHARPDAGYGSPSGFDQAKADYLAEVGARLKELLSRARKAGVAADGLIVEDDRDPAEVVVETAARRKAGLVAMVSHIGNIGAALGGSRTRKVILSSTCPVWTLHPQ